MDGWMRAFDIVDCSLSLSMVCPLPVDIRYDSVLLDTIYDSALTC